MSKLLFFDIDGTLAQGLKVPESAKEAIAQTRALGNKVFICSGRAISYVEKYFSKYADGYIGFNGRMAVFDQKMVYDTPIDPKEVDRIINVLRELNISFSLFTTTHGYFDGDRADYEDNLKIWPEEGFLIYGIPDHLKVYGIDVFYGDEERFQKMDQALPECVFNKHTPHPSADTSFDDIDKGKAIIRMADELKIDVADTYAFGDGFNDIVMLKAAGHGIAMGNGVKEAKAAADYVTTAIDDDGIKNGMKHYGLI